ncbi:MAG: hypothetical protein ACFE0Q_14795 [Anaerolineae bacterium]
MNTSAEAIKQLQATIERAQAVQTTVDNFIAVHDYQDVTSLVIQSAEALLHAAVALLQAEDENALDLIETAEDLIEDVYKAIEGDLDLD